jgi:hypothetical protein
MDRGAHAPPRVAVGAPADRFSRIIHFENLREKLLYMEVAGLSRLLGGSRNLGAMILRGERKLTLRRWK